MRSFPGVKLLIITGLHDLMELVWLMENPESDMARDLIIMWSSGGRGGRWKCCDLVDD